MGMNARLKLQQLLEAIETLLAQGPATIELQFERAWIFSLLGQVEQAKQAYNEILQHDPTNLAVLNNLASLLEKTDPNAARLTYMTALQHHPDDPRVHVNLSNLLLANNRFVEARAHFETALRLDPDCVEAHQGMCLLLQNLGEDEKMQYHRVQGYGKTPVTTPLAYVGNADPIPLLVLVSSLGGSDVPWRSLVDNSIFHVTAIVAAFYDPTVPLPRHKLVFNAIGDADTCQSDLDAAEKLLRQTAAPVLNPPAEVLRTGRITNAQQLQALPGVMTPRVAVIAKEAFKEPDTLNAILSEKGLTFPLLLRSLGFHTGQHFVYVADMPTLLTEAATMPWKSLLAIEYLNARGQDGYVRKYRVMMIDGKLYPLHLAISESWKVHYFTAGMAGHTAHQQEECEFLNHMADVVGEKGMTALKSIQTTLGLDYGGIDFAISEAGDIMVFETNAVMRIIPPSPDPQWDYRRLAIDNALSAARKMLIDRINRVNTASSP